MFEYSEIIKMISLKRDGETNSILNDLLTSKKLHK